ncbi:DUF2254 family protein [Methanosarcina sp. UBA5]|uniref:DUF2254 family protein n=1 Tax=Methanosarcina sp. UBA5 TaxID=1915593 RepID=UPI0025D0C993|nr:DUF2254 family protein [Methanosarcina sp. UBA5]
MRKIKSHIQRSKKQWLLFIVVVLILFPLLYTILFKGITLDSKNVSFILGAISTVFFKGITIDSNGNVLSALGTLAQSNATILAIVISLSLVVIEFSASKYSARVVDVFKNDPILWGFLLLYGLSIFYPVLLIVLIADETNDLLLHLSFSIAYALSIIAYFSLFFYILYVFKMMKPNSVIDALSKNIDVKSLSNSSEEVDEHNSRISEDEPKINRVTINIEEKKDPFLPIIDIIRASIMRYDYTTARYGLGAVSDCLYEIIKHNPHEEKRISEHAFKRIFEIWKLALKIEDSEFIKMVLIEYCNIGERCTSPVWKSDSTYIKFKLKTEFLIPLYNALNKPYSEEKVALSNLLYTTFLSEYYLKEAFKSIVKAKEEECQNLSIILTKCIHDIGSKTFENRYELRINEPVKVLESLEGSISELSYILKDIGIAAINVDSKDALHNISNTFNYIGEAAIYHNLIHSTFHILKNLKSIGEESAKKGEEFELLTTQIVKYLENLASKIDGHSKELAGETQNQVIEYYKHIKQKYEYKRTDNALEDLNDKVKRDISDISSYIVIIGEESIKNNLLDATRQCLKSLETVERILQDDNESREVCKRIKNIGLDAVNKEQTFPLVEDIIKSLYSIGMLQFGYMFDWDRDSQKRNEFLEEYLYDSANGLRIDYSDYDEAFVDKDNEEYNNLTERLQIHYFDEEILELDYKNDKEKTMIINGKEMKGINIFYLTNIKDEYRTLKLFKGEFINRSVKAYYKIPELLAEIFKPSLIFVQTSPTDEKVKPICMIIQCFENFAMMSIHFRDSFSLNRIFVGSLISMGHFLVYDLKYSDGDKDQNAMWYFKWLARKISKALYRVTVKGLEYNLIEPSKCEECLACLIRIEKKYPDKWHDYGILKNVLKIARELELNEIVLRAEGVVTEFENRESNKDED